MQVVFKVILFRAPYIICYVSQEYLVLPNTDYYKSIGVEPEDSCETSIEHEKEDRKCMMRYKTSALFLQPFVKCLSSSVYRKNVIEYHNKLHGYPVNGTVLIKLKLEPPDREIIDHAWNERMLRLLWTRLEIENAFSWLSTLGGAYSALGDYFDHCAEEAGRISLRQYKLSKLLGDEGLAARSKLYSALALSQKGKLQTSRHIVRNINKFALETHDRRLNKMCQGVWAKLKYLRRLKNGIREHGDCKVSD